MKILVAVDGSPFTKKALKYLATHLEQLREAPVVHLLHVGLPLPMGMAFSYQKAVLKSDEVEKYYKDEARKVLSPAEKFLEKKGIVCQSFHATGQVAQEIQEHVKKNKIDFIVMGSHGHGALAGMVLGSVATKVLAATVVPVMIVR